MNDSNKLHELLAQLAKWEIIFIIVGLILSAYFSWQATIQTRESLEITKKLAQNQIFVEYTTKFRDINLPEKSVLDNNLTKLDDSKIKSIKEYFNLIAQEEYLARHDLIESEIWKNWEKSIHGYCKTFCFRKIWKDIENKSYYSDKFRKFIGNSLE